MANAKSIQRKIDIVVEAFDLQTDYRTALMHLLVQWRNNLTHLGAKNTLRPQMRGLIQNNEKVIFDNHRKLDVKFMLDKFDKGRHPEFRDVTTLRGAQLFIEGLDRHFVRTIHVRRFLLAACRRHLASPRVIQKIGNAIVANDVRKVNFTVQTMKELGLSPSLEKPEGGSGSYVSIEEIFSLFKSIEQAKRVVG